MHDKMYTTAKPILFSSNNSNSNKNSQWPLQEFEERRIMRAIIQQQRQQVSSEEEEEEEEEVPLTSGFSERSPTSFFPTNMTGSRRFSTPNSLRCSICHRRFHSKGNLSNHTQLYH
ncbi:MAG: hypothetical protein EXX96DRAFT_649492 [Benjaminiella poitrasii]|nr:MAG: hypothetical protein EXX96DRAFT_649492 [Benjaminiella poitrasii]